MKRKFTLSIIALIGSFLLLIATSYAWFAISNQVNQNPFNINAKGIHVDSYLYVSENGVDYTETTMIDFQNRVPGDIVYYKLVITNSDLSDINTRVLFAGFSDSVADPTGSDENYLAGKSLLDSVLISVSNNQTSYTIDNQHLRDVIYNDTLTAATIFPLDKSATAEVYFSLTFDGNSGNDYQNLALAIEHIYVHSALR